MITIAPSILASDFSKIGAEARRAQDAGADWIHVDVMDGHFVPNITMGPQAVDAIRRGCSIPLDVHLMIDYPQKYVDRFIDAGADIVTVHVESKHDVRQTLAMIKKRGKKCGIVLNPDTPLSDEMLNLVPDIDLFLIMSVFPGFGGQKFIKASVAKVADIAERARRIKPALDIEVDGGINLENAPRIIAAGANVIVSGTTIFAAPDMSDVIRRMRQGR